MQGQHTAWIPRWRRTVRPSCDAQQKRKRGRPHTMARVWGRRQTVHNGQNTIRSGPSPCGEMQGWEKELTDEGRLSMSSGQGSVQRWTLVPRAPRASKGPRARKRCAEDALAPLKPKVRRSNQSNAHAAVLQAVQGVKQAPAEPQRAGASPSSSSEVEVRGQSPSCLEAFANMRAARAPGRPSAPGTWTAWRPCGPACRAGAP